MTPRPLQQAVRHAAPLLRHPFRFIWDALKAFRANQGLLLAGAVAYYALLSIVPLLIVSVIALSHFIDQRELLMTIGRYLEWLLPGQSKAVVQELSNFLDHRDVLGPVLLVTMIFFSSLAFTVLEAAMAVIFHHRKSTHRRHALLSVVMPYVYILCLCVGLLLVTLCRARCSLSGSRASTCSGAAGRFQVCRACCCTCLASAARSSC